MKADFALHRIFLGILLSLATISAQAGGLMTYQYATPNTALANAGAAARAQGPDTMANNIAGLSYLPGTQIMGGAQVLWSDLQPDSMNSNLSGGGGGEIVNPMFGPSFFISHQLDEHWSLGFGSYGDFGTAINYDNDWAGRYYLQNGELIGLSLVPGIAYRFNDQWSVGAGLHAMYGMTDDQLAIDNGRDRPDGRAKYKDNVWGYGGNAGVIYSPQEGTRIGLAYTSQVDLNFKDDLKLEPGTGQKLDPIYARVNGTGLGLDVSVPQTVTLSLFQQLDQQWALLASTNWQQWSQFGEFGINIDPNNLASQNLTVDSDYKDTWHLSLGAQYQATDKWLWSAGVAYDSSAVSDSNRGWTFPMGETTTLGVGANYALDATTSIDVNYGLTLMGDMPVSQSRQGFDGDTQYVNGDFKNAWVQVVSADMTWRY